MKRIAILGLVALCSCASPRPREVYHTQPLTIIVDTEENINKSYQAFTGGTRPNDMVAGFQRFNQIYVRRAGKQPDFYTLGHELYHIMVGDFHK